MQSVYTILLLIVSNIFMTCAWYGHLKMKQQFSWFEHLPLFGVILFSWFLAFFEYCFQVPANRIGFRDNGGPFNLIQLKVIQEVITLVVFVAFSTIAFKGESFKWNHALAFVFLVAAVYLVFKHCGLLKHDHQFRWLIFHIRCVVHFHPVCSLRYLYG